MNTQRLHALLFMLGDYTAGILTGAATAAVVRAIVWPGFDLALAMLLGVGVGTVTHLAVGTLLSPVLGYRGLAYFFASDESRAAFEKDPDRYANAVGH